MADWVVITLVAVFGVILCVCAAALVEVFRQLQELRSQSGLEDEPMALDIRSGELTTSEIGLPEDVARLPEAIVVFLHARCGTCRMVADAFRGGAPESVWFVIPAEDVEGTRAFRSLAEATNRVIAEHDDGISDALGMDVAPAVVTVQYGVVQRGLGVSTAKQVLALVPATPSPTAVPG
jgi:hypothetical protein